MNIQIGGYYRFNYPEEFTTLPDHSAHRGQKVRVIRKLGTDEAEEVTMYRIEAEDGWTGDAFEDELLRIR